MGVPSFFGYRHLNSVFRAGAGYLYAAVPHTASAQTLHRLWTLESRQNQSPPPPAEPAALHDPAAFPWLTIDHPEFHRYVERFQSAFRFAFVRNPYTRIHSIFLAHILPDTAIGRRFRRSAGLSADKVLDFAAFVGLLAAMPECDRHPVLAPQRSWLLYESVPYHAIGAVERYDQDIGALTALAFPSGGTIGEESEIPLPRRFAEAMPPQTAEAILRLYASDFNVFGYDEDPAAATAPPRFPLERTPDQPLYGTPLWLLVDSRAQLLAGNTDVAIRQMEQVIDQGEAEAKGRILTQLRLDLARIHQNRGDLDQALAVLRVAGAEALSDPEYPKALAELQLRRNDPAGALQALVAALPRADASPPAVREIGALCALTGDMGTSLRAGRVITETMPAGRERNRLIDALIAGLSRRGSPRYALAVLDDLGDVPDLGYDIAEPMQRLRGGKNTPPVAARDPKPLPPPVRADHGLQALVEESEATTEFLRQRLMRKVLEAYPFLFDPVHYARGVPDLGKSGLAPLEHYVLHGSKRPGAEPNAFFNHAVYLHYFAREPDTVLDALVHYVVEGAPRGLDPGPYFDSKAYLAEHPHVASTGANPLNDYLAGGGRQRGAFGLLPETVFNGLRQLSFNDTRLFPSSWRLGALKPDAASWIAAERRGAVYSRLSRDLPRGFTHLVLLPWVAHPGGAEQVAASTLRMLVERLGTGAVAAIGTDMASRKGFDLPEGLKLYSLSDYDDALTAEDRVEILDRLILERKPRVTYTLNSLACWMLMDARAHLLKQETALYAAIFAYGFDQIEGTFGFHQHIGKCMDHLTGVITDNSRFPVALPRMTPILSTQTDKVHIVYTPITTTFGAPPSGPRPRQALWMSRFSPEKRMDVLGRIAAGAPDRRFVLYGSQTPHAAPADISFLRDLPNVELAGYFRDLDDVPFSECDLFVYTSSYDGLPVALLEAAAKGLPIIAPNVGGIVDFITPETGWLVSSSDAVDEYLAAIREIEANPELVRRKVSAAQDLLRQRHSWAAFQRRLETLPHFLPRNASVPDEATSPAAPGTFVALSLGEACQPAHHIRRYFSTDDSHRYDWLFQSAGGYPEEVAGSPFNWSITPVAAIEQAVTTDFAGFLDPRNLTFDAEPFRHVLDSGYDIRHVHYFTLAETFMDDYTTVAEKLGKRIETWRRILRSGKRVLFVRQSEADETEAVRRLEGVIGAAYPSLVFRILAVCKTYENRQEGNIVFRRVPTKPGDWQGYNEPWNEAFDAARGLFS